MARLGTPPLTPRELDVISLVALGRTNREIGAQLGISHLTVKHHMVMILVRLRLRNRTEATRWWLTERSSCGRKGEQSG